MHRATDRGAYVRIFERVAAADRDSLHNPGQKIGSQALYSGSVYGIALPVGLWWVRNDPTRSRMSTTSPNSGGIRRRRRLADVDRVGATEPASRLLDVVELAVVLNVSPSWVRKGVLNRTIPYTKIGRTVRFTPEQVALIVTAGERPAVSRSSGVGRQGSARTKL